MTQKLVIKKTATMSFLSVARRISIMISLCLLLVSNFTAIAQTVVTNETFPNQYNTAFGSNNQTNGTFVGSSGTWTASCNSNALSAIAVIQAYYSPVTNAIKIVNWNTSGKGAADCHAASPTVNLSGYTCAPTLDLTFKLYTYTCNAADPNSFFKVEFSTDNGSTWTSVWSMSSAQLFNTYGANGLTTISVAIPAAYRVSGFKYRVSGYKPANESHDFYLFVDDFKITAGPCGSNNASIGDRVWLDADGDGIQDASETGGITGITVQLWNSTGTTLLATTTTNGTGNYLFSGLAAGSYTVKFPVSISGSVVTTQHVGSNTAIDSDPSQSTGFTQVINLTAGQAVTDIDAGYCPVNLSLGNRVWYDTNNNGINDAAENGIRNVTVYLYKDDNNDNVADGASLATALTDVNGNYLFSNLAPGNYIVGAVTPNGYMSSSINGGDPDNNIDLDDNGQVAVGTEMRGLAITLTGGAEPSGNANNTYDFGFLPDCTCTTSAGNLLINASFENGTTGWSWSAANGSLTTGTGYIACGAANGFNNWTAGGASKVWQDVVVAAGSTVTFSAYAGTHTPGLTCSPTLSLIFLNSSNTVIGQSNVTVTRDVDINFSQLAYYSLTAVAPAGTAKARVQSSITCNTMKMDAFCLTATTPGSIGDRVWEDLNRNGIQDAGEAGIANVAVTLYDNIGNPVANTTTNASGNYVFSNLATSVAGTNYQVGFTKPPAYLSFSPNNGAVSVANNSDANVTTGRTANITLTNASPVVDYVDAGIYKQVNISGHVWVDQDIVNPGGVDRDIPAGSSIAIPNNLLIYLIDNATGLIVDIQGIQNETFTFLNVAPNRGYRIQLSQVGYNIGDPLPTNPPINQDYLPSPFTNSGEWLGPEVDQKDGNPNGELFVPVLYQNVYNANFGIWVTGGVVVTG